MKPLDFADFMNFNASVAEDDCPGCLERKKPVAALLCGACESLAVRNGFLAAARKSIPVRFRGARIEANGAVVDAGRTVATRTVVDRMRAMLTGSGLVRGEWLRSAATLAALFAELIDEARRLDVSSDSEWRMRALVRHAARLRWIHACEFDEVRGRGEETLAEAASRASVLVVEDLEPAVATPAGVSALSQAIRRRLSAGKPTIVTTSATPEDLARRFGRSVEEALAGTNPVLDLGVDGVVRDAKVDRNPALHLVGRGRLPGAK
jgi:hypothetical protein